MFLNRKLRWTRQEGENKTEGMTVNSLSAQCLPGERQCFSLQSSCSQASNFSVASCTAIAPIFLFQIRREILFLLSWEALQSPLTVSPCTMNNSSTFGTVRADSPAFGQLFLNQGNRTKQMGGLCLPTIGHCMLPTAVHAEQTNIRDTIKTDLSKGFFTFFF